MILLLIPVLLVIFYYLFSHKIHINFKSFFKKGFHKTVDDYGLFCFTSEQGGGKTFSIVDTIDNYGSGYITISNVESFCKNREETTLYMTDFNQIVDFIDLSPHPEKYLIFFDEIFSALDYGKLNTKARRFLTQLRKRKLHVFTTCQIWSDLPRNFRQLCRYQISCKMFNFLKFGFAICINEINDGYNIKWSDSDQEFICPRIRTNIKKAPLHTALSYDTNETIGSSLTLN